MKTQFNYVKNYLLAMLLLTATLKAPQYFPPVFVDQKYADFWNDLQNHIWSEYDSVDLFKDLNNQSLMPDYKDTQIWLAQQFNLWAVTNDSGFQEDKDAFLKDCIKKFREFSSKFYSSKSRLSQRVLQTRYRNQLEQHHQDGRSKLLPEEKIKLKEIKKPETPQDKEKPISETEEKPLPESPEQTPEEIK